MDVPACWDGLAIFGAHVVAAKQSTQPPILQPGSTLLSSRPTLICRTRMTRECGGGSQSLGNPASATMLPSRR